MTKVQPRVRIPKHLWAKLMGYVMACPVEINGFGLVSETQGVITVQEVFILKQRASIDGVDTDETALSEYFYEMLSRGDDPSQLRFQWHSHGDSRVCFSGKDQANIDNLPGDWQVSLVVNRRRELISRLDVFRPLRLSYDIRPEIFYAGPVPDDIARITTDEVRRLVEYVEYVPTETRGHRPHSRRLLGRR